MGDPKKPKKQYNTPSHPFRKARIEAEIEIKRAYGLKNKTEIWKMDSKLKSYARQAKKIIASRTEQSEKERHLLITKLVGLGLLKEGAAIGEVLNLKIENVLDRRLQTQVVKKNLARSMKQSRQYIVHGHILVSGKKVTSPSYLVKAAEEPQVTFLATSSLSSSEHPERQPMAPKKKRPRPAPERRYERR